MKGMEKPPKERFTREMVCRYRLRFCSSPVVPAPGRGYAGVTDEFYKGRKQSACEKTMFLWFRRKELLLSLPVIFPQGIGRVTAEKAQK